MRLLTALVPAAITALASGDTYYVDADVRTPGDGSSWERAFVSVQEAIDVSTSGDEIWVAEGVYVPEIPAGREATFLIPDGVRLYGGFEGTETALSQRDDPEDFPTILSGELSPGLNAYNVVELIDTGIGTLIDGFEIRDGIANGPTGLNSRGGGVRTDNALGTIRNVIFRDNNAQGFGGALSILGPGTGDFVTVEDCVFEDNKADGTGGAVYTNSDTDFHSCEFIGNASETSGGALYASSDGFIFVEDCRFSGNEVEVAAIDNGLGGAVFIADAGQTSFVRISNTNFNVNVAGAVGAVFVGTSGTVEMLGCGFYGNVANPDGSVNASSAVFYTTSSSTATLVMDTCLFSGNVGMGTASTIFNLAFNSEMHMTNCTIVNNTSDDGITAGYQDLGGYARINNTIFWENSSGLGSGQVNNLFLTPGSDVEVNDSIIGQLGMNAPVPPGSGLSDADPMFVNAAGNNGNPGDLDDNVMLMPGSPAIDAGNSLTVHPVVLLDFYGSARFVDDTGTPDTGTSGGSLDVVDIGAAEFQGTTPPQCDADLNGDGKLDFFDVSAFLTAYNGMDPLADFTDDGMYNFFDVSAFLAAFNAGCP